MLCDVDILDYSVILYINLNF